jgi:multicomponent Na+:H+ antiporter subunit F
MSGLILASATQAVAELGLPVALAAVFVAAIRLLRGPSPVDRVLALDLISILAIGLLGLYALVEEDAVYIDVAIVVALISFLATIGFTRYLTRRPSERRPEYD